VFGYKRPISLRSDSVDCLTIISRWVEECSHQHPECNLPLSTPLPTRVIDLGIREPTDAPVKLYESKNEHAPYLALSHCWGGQCPLTTERATLQLRKSEIEWHSIPNNFRDAIMLARKVFRLRYLWIDSLCIIQDDSSDWELEAGRMSDVYSNAFCTIATDCSGSSKEGFLSRQPLDYSLWESKDGGQVRARLKPHHNWDKPRHPLISPRSSRDPLLTRAWTLQEHLLSRRVIHFTSSEPRFECRQSCACECSGGKLLTPAYSSANAPMTITGPKTSLCNLWHRLVKEYSVRHLTFPSDKLPAISGLATRFQEAGLGKYVAGLWVKNIIKDLIWTIDLGTDYRCNPDQELSSFRAPSWSWASIDYPVWYEEQYMHHTSPERIKCRVISVACIPTGPNATGHISGGRIHINGPVVKAMIRPCIQLSTENTPLLFTALERDGMERSLSLDVRREKGSLWTHLENKRTGSTHATALEPIEVLCLLLVAGWTDYVERHPDGVTVTHGKNWLSLALILTRSKTVPSAFERVALADLQVGCDAWFDGAVQANVEIV